MGQECYEANKSRREKTSAYLNKSVKHEASIYSVCSRKKLQLRPPSAKWENLGYPVIPIGSHSQWTADGCARSRVNPHQRSYCRVSPCSKKLAWFLLTSANLTGFAWGFESRNGRVLVTKNQEAGVLFIPRFFDEEFFEIGQVEKNQRVFPFMYDLPLTKYEDDDYPWNDAARQYYKEQAEQLSESDSANFNNEMSR